MRWARYGIPVVLRLVLGGVLVWAGLAKVSEPSIVRPDRAGIQRASSCVHQRIRGARALDGNRRRCVPAVGILVPERRRSPGSRLLLSFGIAIAVNIYRGANLDCGCFGLDGTRGSLEAALVQDLLLIGMFTGIVVRETHAAFAGSVVLRKRRSVSRAACSKSVLSVLAF